MESESSGLCKILETVKLPYDNSNAESSSERRALADETWHVGKKVAGCSEETRGYRRQERTTGTETEPSEHQSPAEAADCVSSALFQCEDAKQLTLTKWGGHLNLQKCPGVLQARRDC